MAEQAVDPARAGLRRSKLRATALLLVAAAVYLATVLLAADDSGWVGYVRAGAEAGMVGGLADWFAVVALFRRPLGLPIPHTALIPAKKTELGTALGSFVTENFLTEELIRTKIETVDLAGRLGGWLADPAHVELAVDRAHHAITYFVDGMEEDDLLALRPLVQGTLADIPYARFLGSAIGDAVESGQHRAIVDLVIERSSAWLRTNEATVVETIVEKAPWFLPRKATAKRLFRAAVELSEELVADPHHPLRSSFDTTLLELSRELQRSEATQQRIDDVVRRSLERPEVGELLDDLLRSALRTVRESLSSGPVAAQLRARLGDLVRRLADDADLRHEVTTWVEEHAARAVVANRHQVVVFIADTVGRWDADDASRRIELQIGPDLQAIRINGTLVGALAGLAIHLATDLLG
ncbi:MAG TPA: DUF445 domain-containing protein [Mycobacteriales bacterium]|nr:DUF445 domain-containing protein [Mycobacteriales bacterium]